MKKLMLVLAAASLVAGCASNRDTGGTSDQSEMNSSSGSSFTPKQGAGSGNTYDATNTVQNPEQGQP
jgi:hypothetical protein